MKVALLFFPSVKSINVDLCAGTERAFLLLLDFLRKEKIDYKAFSGARIINGQKYKIERLFYFSWLTEVGEKLINFSFRWIPLWKIGNYIRALADLLYCFLFMMKSRDCDLVFTFNVPLMALVSPPKTIVKMSIPPEHLFLPLQTVFKQRYEQAFFNFMSKSLKNNFLEIHNSLSLKNLYVIHNGVDTRIFSPKGTLKRREKKRGLRFLYVSNWNQSKGIFLLLQAVEILEKKGLKFELLIGGGADLWTNLATQRKAKEITKKVYRKAEKLKSVLILGKKNYFDLSKLYNSVDFVIFPSIWQEPFGLVIIEAMACGVPVVAFKRGAAPEIIENKKTGYLIDDISVRGLTTTLQWLIENMTADHIMQMGIRARKAIEDNFSLEIWEKDIKKLLIKRCKRQ